MQNWGVYNANLGTDYDINLGIDYNTDCGINYDTWLPQIPQPQTGFNPQDTWLPQALQPQSSPQQYIWNQRQPTQNWNTNQQQFNFLPQYVHNQDITLGQRRNTQHRQGQNLQWGQHPTPQRQQLHNRQCADNPAMQYSTREFGSAMRNRQNPQNQHVQHSFNHNMNLTYGYHQSLQPVTNHQANYIQSMSIQAQYQQSWQHQVPTTTHLNEPSVRITQTTDIQLAQSNQAQRAYQQPASQIIDSIEISDDEVEEVQVDSPPSKPPTPKEPKQKPKWYREATRASVALETAMDPSMLPRNLISKGQLEELEQQRQRGRRAERLKWQLETQQRKKEKTSSKASTRKQSTSSVPLTAPVEKGKKRKHNEEDVEEPSTVNSETSPSEPSSSAPTPAPVAAPVVRRGLAHRAVEAMYTEEMGSDVLPDPQCTDESLLPPPSKAAIRRCAIGFPRDARTWKPTKLGFGQIYSQCRLKRLQGFPKESSEHKSILRDEAYWGIDCTNGLHFPAQQHEAQEKADTIGQEKEHTVGDGDDDYEDLFGDDESDLTGIGEQFSDGQVEPVQEACDEDEFDKLFGEEMALAIEPDEATPQEGDINQGQVSDEVEEQEMSALVYDSESEVSEEE